MSQTFQEDGQVIPVTWLKCEQLKKLKKGAKVTVKGKSKGKGFAGVVKRWGFKGLPATHGHQKSDQRGPGAIGSAWPEKVLKGKKMPGHKGCKTVTLKNKEIIEIDKKRKRIAVKGPVPGAKKSNVKIVL